MKNQDSNNNTTESTAAENTDNLSDSNPAQEEKNIAMIIWATSIFFWFIPGLVVYFLKDKGSYVHDQAKESLNWNFSLAIGMFISTWLILIFIGSIFIAALFIVHIVFCVMGAIATFKGKSYQVPFAIRLIQ